MKYHFLFAYMALSNYFIASFNLGFVFASVNNLLFGFTIGDTYLSIRFGGWIFSFCMIRASLSTNGALLRLVDKFT